MTRDVKIVVETMRGHNLGKLIFQGEAIKNTGIPGIIGGKGKERSFILPDEKEGNTAPAAPEIDTGISPALYFHCRLAVALLLLLTAVAMMTRTVTENDVMPRLNIILFFKLVGPKRCQIAVVKQALFGVWRHVSWRLKTKLNG